MIKGMLFAFLAAFSWGAAIVMSKKGVEELDAGGVFFWQICSAVILSWIVLFIKRKKLPLNSKAILAYATGVFEPFLAYTFTLYGLYLFQQEAHQLFFHLNQCLYWCCLFLFAQLKLIPRNILYCSL
ncbi:DMT family transporter (plasmid) [Escherichia coli]